MPIMFRAGALEATYSVCSNWTGTGDASWGFKGLRSTECRNILLPGCVVIDRPVQRRPHGLTHKQAHCLRSQHKGQGPSASCSCTPCYRTNFHGKDTGSSFGFAGIIRTRSICIACHLIWLYGDVSASLSP